MITFSICIITVLGGIFYYFHGLSAEFFLYWGFSSVFAGIVFTDIKEKYVYDHMVIAGLLVVLPIQSYLNKLEFAISGILTGFVFSGLIYLLGKLLAWARNYEDAYGSGDVLISVLIGALTGWQEIIFIMIVATFLHLFLGITLYVLKIIKWRYEMPKAPLFAVALICSALLPQGLIGLALNFYLTKLLGI